VSKAALERVAQHVNALLSEQTRPLYLVCDREFDLLGQRGDAK